MTASLYVAHQTAARTRLRLIGDRKNDTGIVEAVADMLAALPGVARAEPRPVSRSVVIRHPGLTADEFNTALHGLPLDLCAAPEPSARPALTPLSDNLGNADAWLSETSGGRLDVRTVLVVAMLSLAFSQAVRGNIMAPATSLLWYAMDLLLRHGKSPSA